MYSSVKFQKVIEFLNWVNVMQEQVGQPAVDMKCAVKFLSARKFDVTRAITLFRNHEVCNLNFLLIHKKLTLKSRFLIEVDEL